MRWPIPAPTNFSEGQRALYGCLVALAGMFAGAVCLGFIAILFGGVLWKVWPQAMYVQIVSILGYGFAGFIIAMIAVIMTLAVGGPVGRFKASASLKDGASMDMGDHESASVVTTTKTEVKPPSPTPPEGPSLP